MAFLGIDWGEKRIGLAFSEDGVIAFPFCILPNTDPISDIARLVQEKNIQAIVLGWPLGLAGFETDKTREVEEFYQALLSLGIPIHKIDERYSTKMVPREGRGIDMKDAVSAQMLLQEYLDTKED